MFTLNPILQQDCVIIGRFPLSMLLLMNDSQYPWFILVPQVADTEELYQLSAEQQQQLQIESNWLAQWLKQHFEADKINVAALGNVVRQLHIHHVARFEHDVAWPAPIWGKHAAQPYDTETLNSRLAALKLGLKSAPAFEWLANKG